MAAVETLKDGGKLPPRSYVLTFDDGYRTVWDEVFPVMVELGVTATIFMTTGVKGFSGRERRPPPLNGFSLLSLDEARTMNKEGISFGAHTLNHPDLTRLHPEQMEAELLGSKRILEEALGTEVESCAYPFGLYDEKVRETAAHHFKCACSDRLGLSHPGDDPFALPRVDAFYLRAPWAFGLMTTGFFPWYVLGRAMPRAVRRLISWRKS